MLKLTRTQLTSRSALYAGAFGLSLIATTFAIFDLAGFAVLFLVLATAASVVLARYDNMFHMAWLSGHVVFCVVPSLICLVTGFAITYELPTLCTLMTVVALAITDRPTPQSLGGWQPRPALFVYVAVIATVVMVVTKGGSFLYTIATLVMMFGVTSRTASRQIVVGLYLVLVGFVLAYTATYWNGFGRLIVAGTLIIPTIVLCRKIGLPGGKYAILAAISMVGLLGTIVRFREVTLDSILRTSLIDSNSGPLLLGQSFVTRARIDGAVNVSDWFDQFMLLALAAWPREWWSDKPRGFGAVWVAENLGPGFPNHSIASTFVGEHIYYLGLGYGSVASLAVVALICWGYNALGLSRYFLGLGGYLIAVHLPTFYWGGMASFAVRFWIGLVPLVVAFALFQIFRFSLAGRSPAIRTRRNTRLTIHGR